MKVLRWMLTAAGILIISDVAIDAFGLGAANVADAAARSAHGAKEGGTGVPPTPRP